MASKRSGLKTGISGGKGGLELLFLYRFSLLCTKVSSGISLCSKRSSIYSIRLRTCSVRDLLDLKSAYCLISLGSRFFECN